MNHLSAELIGAQLDHRLQGAERDVVLQHLELCADCREEIAAVQRLVRVAPATRRRAWVVAAGAIAAVAAFVTVARLPMPNGAARDGSTLRIAQPDLVLPIVAVSPVNDIIVTAPTVELTWKADDTNATYRATLQDETGRVIWTTPTRDTTVVVPDTVKLTAGNAYYWSVDALRPDGRSTTSKAHRFHR